MFKKVFRRSAISSTIVCLTLAVVCLGLVGSADPQVSQFASVQSATIRSAGYSVVLEYNNITGAFFFSPFNLFNWTYFYTIGCGQTKTFYIYDYSFLATYTEAFVLSDVCFIRF